MRHGRKIGTWRSEWTSSVELFAYKIHSNELKSDETSVKTNEAELRLIYEAAEAVRQRWKAFFSAIIGIGTATTATQPSASHWLLSGQRITKGRSFRIRAAI